MTSPAALAGLVAEDEALKRLRSIWNGMKQRCFNPNAPKFKHYGGRGITVCNAWRNSFEQFRSDMGIPPPGRSIDRINNDGNYEPGNCRWATWQEQCRNQRPGAPARENAFREICVNGHPLDAGNVYLTKRGRHCRTCQRELDRRYKEVRRQKAKASGTYLRPGQNRPRCKLSIEDAKTIMASSKTAKELALRYGVGETTIWKAKHGVLAVFRHEKALQEPRKP